MRGLALPVKGLATHRTPRRGPLSASKSFEVAEKVLRRAPEGRGFSPSAKRAPTHSTICGQGVGAVAPVGANRE